MEQLLIAFLGSCIAMPVLYAQEMVTVTGTVTNAETGNPIEWVSVYDKDNFYDSTYTDKNGKYSIKTPLGTDVVFARHYYSGKSYTVDSIHYNVALKPVPKEIQQAWDKAARESSTK
jgi:hypothetical protein